MTLARNLFRTYPRNRDAARVWFSKRSPAWLGCVFMQFAISLREFLIKQRNKQHSVIQEVSLGRNAMVDIIIYIIMYFQKLVILFVTMQKILMYLGSIFCE